MYFTISEEASAFLCAGGFGMILGALYDVVRLMRFPRRKALGACLDAVFVLLACLMLLGFVLTVLDGQMRFYVLLGVGLGWMIYAYTLSPTVSAILRVVFRIVTESLRGIGSFIRRSFGGVYHLMQRIRKGLADGHRKKSERKKGEVLWQKEENVSGSSQS